MSAVHDLSLSHFAEKPLGPIVDAADVGNGKGCYKPAGLWISVDGEDDWPSWCAAESFGTDRLKLRYRIVLAPDTNVLLLATADALFDFTDEYSQPNNGGYFREIDWPRVAQLYDGLIIAPYQWDCRLDDRTNWYYGWDCASGVIWRARAILRAEADASGEKAGLTQAARSDANTKP